MLQQLRNAARIAGYGIGGGILLLSIVSALGSLAETKPVLTLAVSVLIGCGSIGAAIIRVRMGGVMIVIRREDRP